MAPVEARETLQSRKYGYFVRFFSKNLACGMIFHKFECTLRHGECQRKSRKICELFPKLGFFYVQNETLAET